MIEKFLTTEQVANILQVHPFTILRLIKTGKLKGIKLGRVYRIKEDDVKEFLENASASKNKKKDKDENSEVYKDFSRDDKDEGKDEDNGNEQHYQLI